VDELRRRAAGVVHASVAYGVPGISRVKSNCVLCPRNR
jgi:hypothetical protein